MIGRRRILALAFALASIAASDRARACEPGFFVTDVWPAGGDLPANAFAVVTGDHLQAGFFSVLVDDQPVEFVVSEHLSENLSGSSPWTAVALRPAVPLPAGATWTLRFEADKPEDIATFTVTAPDLTAPAAPPASLHFDVDDFIGATCNNCFSFGVNYWLHPPPGVDDGGALLVHVLYVGHEGADDDEVVALRRVDAKGPVRAALEPSWFLEGQASTEGVCFTLRLLDAAGNEAASALRSCAPCHAHLDPMPEECVLSGPLEEPAWTDADLFPGGVCMGESAAPLPPETFPEPDTTTGDATGSGGDATSDDGTGGEVTSAAPETDTSATSSATVTGGEPTPTTSVGATLDPPDTGETASDAGDTAADAVSGTGESAGEEPGKSGCGCDGVNSSPLALAWLALLIRRRRSRDA